MTCRRVPGWELLWRPVAVDFFRVYSLPSSAPAHSRSFTSTEWDDSQSGGFSYSGSCSKSDRRTPLTAEGERGSCAGRAFHSEHASGGSTSNKRSQGSLEETRVSLAVRFRGNFGLESLEGTLSDGWAVPTHPAHIYRVPPECPAFSFLFSTFSGFPSPRSSRIDNSRK